ncbi:hypothetical protein [Ruegeria atlantica]|nr:hypothetical protein [Ruegeria atlantica]
MSQAQMQYAVVLAAGVPAMQVLGCITLDLIWCANREVKQLAERPRKSSRGSARVERKPGREIEVDDAIRWPNTVPSSCLVLHDASPSGFMRRLRRIEREPLRQALMDGTGPFGGWDNDADEAFDATFDRFEAMMPDEVAVAKALDQLERTKTIKRPTHRNLIVLPQRLMQANPAVATQVQAFLTAATMNDGAQSFGQNIAESLEPVPQKPRSKLTRKERHIADRQELLLQTDRADAAEARIAELEQLLQQMQPVPDVPMGGDVTDDRSLTAPTQGRRKTR